MERTGNDGPKKRSQKRKHSSTTETKYSKYQKVEEAKKASEAKSLSASSSHGRTEIITNEGNAKPKKKSAKKMPPLVYFDLETTGLGVSTESITQIAALSKDKSFDVYVRPTCPIRKWPRDNTHLMYDRKNQQMYYKGEKIHSEKPKEALNMFMSYLRAFSEPVILVAHNGHKFDAVILYYQLKSYNLWGEFVDLVKGFADSLPMFRQLHPDLRKYILETLATNFLRDESYATHNAIDDTRILKTLVENEGNINHLVNNCFQECSEIQKYPNNRILRSTMGWL